MARPTVAHQGLFVPNAQDVAQPSMAEPDRIDFNTLGNSRWGVIEGCLVTVSGSTATVTSGTALVNGVLTGVAGGQSANHGTGGTQDRFDLVGVDANGSLKILRGAPGADPVFPDPGVDFTTFAAVLCTSGGADYSSNVVDKRNFLLDSLLTKIPPTQDLIVNRNGSGNLVRIDGQGAVTWNDDTWMARAGIATLRIQRNIVVDENISAGKAITAEAVAATKTVTGSNLVNLPAPPASGLPGDIYQNSLNGRLYVWRNNHWDELATLSSATPVGTVLQSLQSPDVMVPLGWIPLDGRVIDESTYPTLFTIPALTQYISGNAPNRSMVMPDSRRRMLLTDFTQGGQLGGSSSIQLLTEHLPPHKHNVKTLVSAGINMTARTGRAGIHRHSVTGGEHGHAISDPGHKHRAMESPLEGAPGDPVCLFWGGQNKIDALFNDRSHTYSVEPLQFTVPALTDISVSSAGSWHTHEVSDSGDHDHVIVIDPIPGHIHTVTEDTVGSGSALTFTPAYLGVYTYVRT